MQANMDDLLIIIGRQTVQIALLEAELALKAEPPVEHKAMSKSDMDEVAKAFA